MKKEPLQILKETSRTFYIPIVILPKQLKQAVASAYLCMRAIDEVEDSSLLDNKTKARILRAISRMLLKGADDLPLSGFSELSDYEQVLPEVTIRIQEWALLASPSIAPRICESTAAMAERMAYWSERHWRIDNQEDLDHYTFSVAGAVGLLLSDLWGWYDNTQTNRTQAIAFGRGLQTVNILRNVSDDAQRGVNFFPRGWTHAEMQSYARKNLVLADAYTEALPKKGPARRFCEIPLALAYRTLEVLEKGEAKLSRDAVLAVLKKLIEPKDLAALS